MIIWHREEGHGGGEKEMVAVRHAFSPETPGMHTPLFREAEIYRAESIASALDGLDIYSARMLLEKMETYLLLTEFQSATD